MEHETGGPGPPPDNGPLPERHDAVVAAEALGQVSSHPTVSEPDALERTSTTLDDPSAALTPAVLESAEHLSRVSSGPPYSAFSPSTKIWVTTMVTIASVISPMTANLYFPSLNDVAADLHVSVSLINLTITTYMAFQGLAPTISGGFGDRAGRRPAFIVAFLVYLVANIGLALQRDYAALMVLRCLQSAGSSGTLVLAYAVVADISSSDERGRYMGIVGAGVNVGPTMGPVLGGILSQFLGWPSIFWFCAVFVFVWLIPWTLSVPETCRAVVGNGSIPPPKWNMTLIDFIRRRGINQRPESAPKVKMRMPNPLKTLYIVFRKEEGLLLFISAIIYLNFILVAATLSTLLMHIYKFDALAVGLCYLPYGIGCCFASLVQGYVADWNYRRIAKKLGVPVQHKRGEDPVDFPIETARIQPIYPALLIGAGALIGWAWALEVEANVAVPLVLLFIIGMLVPTSFNVLNTLIIDINPDAPATAAAANNLVRCSFGAVATAVIDNMLHAMGRGWCFTFLALIMVLCLVGLRVLEKRGPRWRAERAEKAGKRTASKSER
ncbi:Quinidine resistance protein 2 [Tolypocladium paradoxum]|uniref:Quinidine resistance protein 2 n=1 Tax=Tolypocladium paradoxum TaxID=94208 RepID=A0A2S4L0E7_9HYPO|nr:Quinidine resistance protein 2 [Tolypocladium paradoxum]